MKKLLLLIALAATTSFYGQDVWNWVDKDGDFPQAPSVTIEFTYTAASEIAVGDIKMDMWSVSGGVWSANWRGWSQNWSALPAGTDLTGSITISTINAAVLNGDGNIMTKAELLAADPNGAGAGITNYYYEIRLSFPKSASGGFAPTNSPASPAYKSANASLSNANFEIKNLRVFPNPVSNELIFSDYQNFKSVSIYNLIGQEVKKVNSERNIDVSDLTSGVYILKTNTGATSKFVKN